jgi:hypothetical protein
MKQQIINTRYGRRCIERLSSVLQYIYKITNKQAGALKHSNQIFWRLIAIILMVAVTSSEFSMAIMPTPNCGGSMSKKTQTKKGSVAGTYEWSQHTLNFQTGCEHNCLYCYSKEISVRYGRSDTASWTVPYIRKHDVAKKIKDYDSIVMFPSSHDITPNNLNESLTFISNILNAGNKILIVSKPHLDCVKSICKKFKSNKNKILFRFTIGSVDDAVLKFWEPGAPDFKERYECLRYAFKKGFQTSVSCEPMLDNNIAAVIKKVSKYVTETIWLGKANNLLGKTGQGRLERNGVATPLVVQKANELNDWQNDDNMITLYNKYKTDHKIRFKESIKRIISKQITK